MPKLKVCMASSNTREDAQMLAEIQALPKGDMKSSLLDSFLKTMMKTTQKSHDETSSGKKHVFVDASFEKNAKSFIKHNRNEKLQPLTLNDLGKELNNLKREVSNLKHKVQGLES